jgi:hypothetical protein
LSGYVTVYDAAGVSYNWAMNHDEIAICAGPRTDYADVIVAALNEECIPARIVTIADVMPEQRPIWAHESVLEIFVVVPESKRDAAWS